jgi:hypothetical protein
LDCETDREITRQQGEKVRAWEPQKTPVSMLYAYYIRS